MFFNIWEYIREILPETKESSESGEYWKEKLVDNLLKAMPGETIKSINDTPIEYLFSFIGYLNMKNQREDVPEWFKPHLKKLKGAE